MLRESITLVCKGLLNGEFRHVHLLVLLHETHCHRLLLLLLWFPTTDPQNTSFFCPSKG